MTLADLSIKRPVFITAIVTILLVVGYMAMRKMPVDLFPNVTFPIVMVNTVYPGAGPEEVEVLVSKVLEEEMSTLTGIKSLRSINNEGVSTVVAEFTLETDIKYAEQQIRDKVSSAKRKLPSDIEESVIRRMDPADQPILIMSLSADLPEADLYDVAEYQVKPRLEQVNQVGLVEIIGGRKREIHVELDREKLKAYELSASTISNRIGAAGQNIPAGKFEGGKDETVMRTLGQFQTIKDIETVVVSFLGNDRPVTVKDVGQVRETVQDQKSKAYMNGNKSVFLMLYRQSGANTVAVADGVKKSISKINDSLKSSNIKADLQVVRDGANPIRANLYDVQESILIGVILTIIVVYFFLGSGRSTFITGLALPNSLIGAFFLMSLAGFSINVMSLLALSLAVGLLIDDAIVVRENIFRHAEMGKDPIKAASDGTKEVLMAVIATTMAVISVFAPMGFLSGVVGQFFKEFALTICFAMVISLFDAVTMAPMLSAYFGGAHGHGQAKKSTGIWANTMGRLLKAFDRFQSWLEDIYENVIRMTLKRPFLVIGAAIAIFAASIFSLKFVSKTFLPAQDTGEFSLSIETPPGTSLDGMSDEATKVDTVLRSNSEVLTSVMFVGGQNGQPNMATFFVNMVPRKDRKVNTTEFKERVREQMKQFAHLRPLVKDVDMMGGGIRPFTINIVGTDLKKIEEVSSQVLAKLKNHPALVDVDTGYRPGKPEFQVVPNKQRAEQLGISTTTMGMELRTLLEGATPAVFRQKGEEYDIRVRLRPEQRDLQTSFNQIYIPNVNQSLVLLKNVADPVKTTGPANITRQDRARYIQIGADINPKGPGLGAVMEDVKKMFETDIKLPPDMRYVFVGQAESFQELMASVVVAVFLGVLLIYLVLASLYESFVTPITILLVLPLAACGAFFALLIANESLNMFSMIGCIMLLGVATKNSILLVDYTNQLIQEGRTMADAIIYAGRVRLRPILMTTLALIAGMLPIAIGLNEASKQRTAMGVAVIGGLISSTLLTLVVVPAAFSYFERFRRWSLKKAHRIAGIEDLMKDAEARGSGTMDVAGAAGVVGSAAVHEVSSNGKDTNELSK
ncbi:MAG: efflux RND transporter permease subunit [Bdellovibrionaceae bacterium]|nr:efflux RND transporter permease subunit [Pseudobdellovibrionaceae bacterium]